MQKLSRWPSSFSQEQEASPLLLTSKEKRVLSNALHHLLWGQSLWGEKRDVILLDQVARKLTASMTVLPKK